MADGEIPADILRLAIVSASKTRGDRVSIAIAQWALETGWGTSAIWLENRNPFGIKVAQDARFQLGENRGHATYRDLRDAFRDRERILSLYDARARRDRREIGDVIAQLDRWWAPDQDYRRKLEALIDEHRLGQYDTQHPPRRADLEPSDPYISPGDPRDSAGRTAGKEGAMPWWLTLVGFLLPRILPRLGKGILGDLLGAAGKAELAHPGAGQGAAKEDAAVRELGGDGLDGIGDMILRALIQLLIQWIDSKKGKGELLALADSTGADGRRMADRMLA